MKTTLELPDTLLRQIKFQAALEGKKLKDLFAELLIRGMSTPPVRRRKLPPPHKLRRGFIPTTEDIEAAIAEGRE